MALDLEIDQLDPATAVVALTGTLTLGTNLKTAEATVQQLIADGITRLVLDLTSCAYADSAGLGFLVFTSGAITKKGGKLRLCGLSPRVTDLLTMTHTDSLLQTDPDRATSLQHLA